MVGFGDFRAQIGAFDIDSARIDARMKLGNGPFTFISDDAEVQPTLESGSRGYYVV